MIDTQAIRSKILDLAIRGQLTEQLPEDGTAEKLYQQIQEEKAVLIKTGIIKKEKQLPRIQAEEVPFSLPESWKWVYLGELFQHNTGKALNASDRQGQMLDYITTSNLYWDRFELDDLKQMPFTESEIEKCTVKKGDLLLCEGGDIGRSAIWPFDYDMRIQNHIHRLRKYSDSICTEFYYYLLWFYKQTGRINGIGIGLQGFSSKRVHSLVVPFAPYSEAVRVVEKVKAAFSILDTIDTLQAEYAENRVSLKSKLIEAAIQGKLTEQLSEDGMAEELYQQIQAEKQKLIRTGKIKKEDLISEVAEEEIPFEIPGNWKWIRLKDLGIFSGGKTPSMKNKSYWENGVVPWVTSKDMKQKYISSSEMLISESAADEMAIHPEKTVLFVVRSGILRRLFPVAILTEKGTINQDLKALELFIPDMCEFVYYLLKGFEPTILFRYAKDGTTVNNIVFDALLTMPIPLPPLPEQRRIVAKLDELIEVFGM